MPRPLHGWGAEAPRRALGRPAEKRQSQDWNPRRTDDSNRSCRGGGFRGKRTEGRPRSGDSEATEKLTHGTDVNGWGLRRRLGVWGAARAAHATPAPPCPAWRVRVPGILAR